MVAEGRSFDELASLVVAATEARAGSSAEEEFAKDARGGRGAPVGVLRVTE